MNSMNSKEVGDKIVTAKVRAKSLKVMRIMAAIEGVTMIEMFDVMVNNIKKLYETEGYRFCDSTTE